MKSNPESEIQVGNNGSEPEINWHPFLYGAIVGAVIGWPLIYYLSRDTGDAPSVAMGVGLSYMAIALAGGVGCLLLLGVKEALSEKGPQAASTVVGFTILGSIFVFLLWFCYSTMTGVMAFRKHVMDIEARAAIREYKEEIEVYLAKNGKLPPSLDELRYRPPRAEIERGINIGRGRGLGGVVE